MTVHNFNDKLRKVGHLDKLGFAMRDLRLDQLDAFVAIVRAGGFRAAALERGVSSSALSQSIKALEDAMGIRLLNRTTRSLSPTEAGRRLLERLGPAIGDIKLAIAELDDLRDTPSGTIRINAPAPAVDHCLIPLIHDFLDHYKDVKIELISDAAVVDIVEQGFDAGVRFGQQLAQDMIAVPLGASLRYAIVASPKYLEQFGTPKTPHDLIDHNCIRRKFPGGTLVTWNFVKADEHIEVIPQGNITLSTAVNEMQTALANKGLAHVLQDYSRTYVENGDLVEVLKDWCPMLPSWYLYYPNRRLPSAAMRAFLGHLKHFNWSVS